ncbi:membrane integrity-associated transporter subunit PqiC [Rosenbergiella nectarea]|uniref:membrane integrity-associated transporter subunit PqiC n=1 Tax=Rosenbergiella nectarea TaxID=988801 RepID=UPI001BD9E374|nr:membrane integrity-associated transporter subunit PqiC [Rosenbergiella nectarea subsp. apis]
MKKLLIALLAVCLTACSSSESTKYYQLTTPQGAASVATSTTAFGQQPKHLWVQSINLPDALANTGIAFQTSEVEYRLAEKNLWASPLDQQLQQTLITNLSNLMPNWLVTNTSLKGDTDSLAITVTAFQGRWDGHALVKGYWLYQHQDEAVRRPFERIVPLNDDGYPALVQALSQAWYQEAQQLASQINP